MIPFEYIAAMIAGVAAIVVAAIVNRFRPAESQTPILQALDRILEDGVSSAEPYPDAAIAESFSDELSRGSFVRRLSELIAKTEGFGSFVLAIDGPWGSGKTSVLNLVEAELRQREHVIVRFDPWELSRTALPAQFYLRLAAAALSHADRAEVRSQALRRMARKFVDLARVLEPSERARTAAIYTVFRRLVGLNEAYAAPDIGALHSQLIDLIDAVHVRMVIMIDDLDRLEPSEQVAFLRFIRTTGQLPLATYVLAMDYASVSKNVNRAMNDDTGRYLDKIVQLPVALPAATRERLDQMLFSRLDFSSEDWEGAKRTRHFTAIYLDGVRRLIRTPRDTKRVALAYRSLELSLQDEVNHVDLLALSALQVLCPLLFQRLPAWRDVLLGPPFILGSPSIAEAQGAQADFHEAVSPRDHEAVDAILFALFPFYRNALQGKETRNSERIDWRRDRRIAEPNHFDYVFAPSMTEGGEFTHAEVAEVLEIAKDRAALEAELEQIAASMRATSFLSRLVDDVQVVPEETVLPLMIALLDCGDSFPVGREQGLGFADNSLRIAWIIDELIKRSSAETFVRAVQSASRSLYTPAVALSVVGTSPDADSSAPRDLASPYLPARDIIVTRISDAVSSGLLFRDGRLYSRSGISFLIARWWNWADKTTVRKQLEAALERDDDFITFLTAVFFPTASRPDSDLVRFYEQILRDGWLLERIAKVLASDYVFTLDRYMREQLQVLDDALRMESEKDSQD